MKTFYKYKNNNLKSYIIRLQIVIADLDALLVIKTYKYLEDGMNSGNVYIKDASLQLLRLANKCYKSTGERYSTIEIISLKEQYRLAKEFYYNFHR